MAWGDYKHNDPNNKIITSVDMGAGDDKTIISLFDGKKHIVIGESIELTIPTGAWKSKTVGVIQVGDLAVYMGDEEDVQVIIHVPTLAGFDKALPEGDWTQEQLIQWCWKVQQSNWSYWAQLHKFNNDTYATIDKAILDNVKAYCLSISPGS